MKEELLFLGSKLAILTGSVGSRTTIGFFSTFFCTLETLLSFKDKEK